MLKFKNKNLILIFVKMKKNILLLFVFCIPFFVLAQEDTKKEEKPLKLKLTGFVKNDFFWDTRKTVAAREGHFLLWPSAVSEDADGNDINAKSNFNFLSVQSRVTLGITGPDAFGAKTSAKIESDFFAQANDNINLLRLRHAYIKLNWTNTELLTGQYWNPMFITGCFPGTVSFNTGTPIQPFARNPQIRLTQKAGNLKFMLVAASQRDYTNRGAVGPTGEYLRNSAMPEISAQIHFTKEKSFLTGVGGSFKKIIPQLVTGQGYATSEAVTSFNGIAFLRINTAPVTIKMEGIFGQNTPDVLNISGFAVTDSTDKVKGFVKYSPLSNISAWTDIHTNGKKIQFGIFAGYTKQLGSAEDVVGPIYGLGVNNIESLYRVAPRIMFNSGKVRFAVEGEYTVANYGTNTDIKGIPTDLKAANNLRLLASVYYFFK